MKTSTTAPAAPQRGKPREWLTLWVAHDADLLDGLDAIAAYLTDHPDERPATPGQAGARGRRQRPGRTDAVRAAVREMLARIGRQ
jgi:hypothetical protein